MGGAWSCCLPCASGGGGGGGAAVSGATPEAKKGSIGHKCQQQQQQSQHLLQHHPQQKQQEKERQQHQQQNKASVSRGGELAPLSNLDEDLDDLEDEKGIEQRGEEEEYAKEGGTQHRLSPRLHDIEEEDDEDGRNTKERSVHLALLAARSLFNKFEDRFLLSRLLCALAILFIFSPFFLGDSLMRNFSRIIFFFFLYSIR